MVAGLCLSFSTFFFFLSLLSVSLLREGMSLRADGRTDGLMDGCGHGNMGIMEIFVGFCFCYYRILVNVYLVSILAEAKLMVS